VVGPQQDLDGVLRRCPLFNRVDDQTMAQCAGLLRLRRYRKGETIFHQGDAGDALFVIQSGAVKIVLPSPDGDEEAIIATLRPGDFFGELALVDGADRSATAIAHEPTAAYQLNRFDLERLMEIRPQLRVALLEAVARELRRLTRHVDEMHFLNLPGRLARRIVSLAREADPEATGEVTLPWQFSQSELASMIGATRPTVNRMLSGFAEEGLLRIDRDVLVVPDLERLDRVAER
jgi:CRP/FNR family transcriptional regulator, cyclic AMP receptor protein